jgi:orotate phosphoribosyltransferase
MKQHIRDALEKIQAVITGSHLVYTSGKHGETYFNKDAIYPHTEVTSMLCEEIARHFVKHGIEVVVAPAVGGVILSQWIAYHLTKLTGREVLGVYAEKDGEGFIIKRGYDKLCAGKKVLIVEDILTTGGSVKKVIDAARAIGANVMGLGVLCNRGGIKPEDVSNPPELFALINVNFDAWDEKDCPLCAKGVPVNIDVGHGRKYMQDKKA